MTMKRRRRRVVRLLDLPAEVLHLILSFLGTLPLAAACLACRALRDAARSGRKRVVLKLDGWYEANALASPRVLQSMHAVQILLDRVEKDMREVDADSSDSSATPHWTAYHQQWHSQKRQLLLEVAQEVESLKLGHEWFDAAKKAELPCEPHVLLSGMPRLGSLHLTRPLDAAILRVLTSLGHLTSVRFGSSCSIDDVRQLCSLPTLANIDLGAAWNYGYGAAFDSQQVLAIMAAGRQPGLQDLVLPFPAAEAHHLSRLTAVTTLTALEFNMCGSLSDLGGVASLTALRSLHMRVTPERLIRYGERHAPVSASLAPLTALRGLTCLDLREDMDRADRGHTLPSDFSVLSSLTALRVLRCSMFDEPKRVGGDPLPVQFRFLRSATALEELDLGFWAPSWSLRVAPRRALREAVATLKSLRKVSLCIYYGTLEQHCALMRVFSAASSIEAFKISWDEGFELGRKPGFSTSEAFGCFSSLTRLQSLTLLTDYNGYFPHADLLAGLPSTRLTSLDLWLHTVNSPLTQQIARFGDLQALAMRTELADPRFLDPLFDLKCLTLLKVEVDPLDGVEHEGAAVSAVRAQASRLTSAVVDRALELGVKADAEVFYLGGWA